MSIGTGTTRRRARPAPRTALLLLGHLPLTGVNVTVLNVVALDQARGSPRRRCGRAVRTSSGA
ncbi:hypothetical protein ACFQX6_49675 [Streptosporangium lutulentum]